MVDPNKTRPDKLAEMCDSLFVDNAYLRDALRTARENLYTCNCRWEGETQVHQCTLHEAHVEAIHDWASRAKLAEAKVAELEAEVSNLKSASVVYKQMKHIATLREKISELEREAEYNFKLYQDAGKELCKQADSIAELEQRNAMLLAALEAARNGLKWYQDSYPDAVSEAGGEEMARIDTAIAAAKGGAAQREPYVWLVEHIASSEVMYYDPRPCSGKVTPLFRGTHDPD